MKWSACESISLLEILKLLGAQFFDLTRLLKDSNNVHELIHFFPCWDWGLWTIHNPIRLVHRDRRYVTQKKKLHFVMIYFGNMCSKYSIFNNVMLDIPKLLTFFSRLPKLKMFLNASMSMNPKPNWCPIEHSKHWELKWNTCLNTKSNWFQSISCFITSIMYLLLQVYSTLTSKIYVKCIYNYLCLLCLLWRVLKSKKVSAFVGARGRKTREEVKGRKVNKFRLLHKLFAKLYKSRNWLEF